jgi:hypothetical protein
LLRKSSPTVKPIYRKEYRYLNLGSGMKSWVKKRIKSSAASVSEKLRFNKMATANKDWAAVRKISST